MPKSYLGTEQTMETYSTTHPQTVQKNMDNAKQIRSQICKYLHTTNRISFGRETPNWVTPNYDDRHREKEEIYT